MSEVWNGLRRFSLRLLIAAPLVAAAGCSGNKPPPIDPRGTIVPSEATLAAEGKKFEDLTWTAPAAGTVHIVDVTDEKLIHRDRVGAGERVVVRMKPGALEIGRRRISRRDIDMSHRIRVYFVEGGGGTRR